MFLCVQPAPAPTASPLSHQCTHPDNADTHVPTLCSRCVVPCGSVARAVLPDKCSLHLVALTDADRHASRIEFWDDVYGFKMPMIKKEIYKDADVAVVNPGRGC